MDFKQLQSFAAVVRCASFTKAAEQLFISQPTISAHVRQLEEELDQRLILRTTKSIEVTEKGMEVYEYAVSILELKTRMLETCAAQPPKIIHLGASTIPSAYILPDILPEFSSEMPDTYFAIHQSDSQGIVDGLKEGLFDVGLIGMSVEDDDVECVPFCRDQMILITPVNEHFLELKNRAPVPLEELLREPIIMREKGSGSKKAVEVYLERIGVPENDLHVIARVNDQEAIKRLVVGGLGVSIISDLAARNFLSEKRILGFPLSDGALEQNLYLITRRSGSTKPYVKRFIRFALSRLES